MTDDAILTQATLLGAALQARGWRCATAESCTGGLVGGAITEVAGSSAWFERGFVTYTNASKTEMLGVPAALLATQGAVSEAVAAAMATGALAHSHADLAVAVTGVAGPAGGTADKPVGMVCFGWARRGEAAETATLHLPGDRSAVRAAAVLAALTGLRERIPGPGATLQ